MAQVIGGDAPLVLTVLWALAAVNFVLVILRLYTRLKVLKMYGVDDHFFNMAFALFLVYDIMIQISAKFGFGRDVTEIALLDDVPRAILYEAIGQTLFVIGTVIAKISMSLFLIRLVTTRLDTVIVWVPVVIFGVSAAVSLVVFWFSCTPTAYLWDRRINGHCNIDPGPVAVHAGAWGVIVDLWYVGFPWYLIWKLNMPKKERIFLASSMSFGLLAGVCGINRAGELYKLGSSNYPKDTVHLIVWQAAELTATIIGVGIPTCLPLYQHIFNGFLLGNGGNSKDLFKRPRDTEINVMDMNTFRTIGGTVHSSNKGLVNGRT